MDVDLSTSIFLFLYIFKLNLFIYFMKKVYNIHNINSNDKLYCKIDNEDYTYYHIFKLGDVIIQKDDIILDTIACYSFMVPVNKNLQAFLYDDCTKIKIKKTDSLYKLNESEYLETYLTFVRNDKKKVYELPPKLIQDVI